jgi:hypothetical protein
MDTFATFSAAATGIAAGAFVGYAAERLTGMVDLRGVATVFAKNGDAVEKIDNVLLLALQAGIVGIGASVVAVTLPVTVDSVAGATLFAIAVTATVPTLRERIKTVTHYIATSTAPVPKEAPVST